VPNPLLIGGGVAAILYYFTRDDDDGAARPDPKASEQDLSDVTPGYNFDGQEALVTEGGVQYFEKTLQDGTKVAMTEAGEVLLRDGEIKPTGTVKQQSTTRDDKCGAVQCAGPVSQRLQSKRIGESIYAGLINDVIV
jgi:hypothetical protein